MKEIILSMKGRIDELLKDKEELQKKTKENKPDQKKDTPEKEKEKNKKEKKEAQKDKDNEDKNKANKILTTAPETDKEKNEDNKTTKRTRAQVVTTETETDDEGFQKVETKKSRKTKKRTTNDLEEIRMDAETTSMDMETTSITGVPVVPTRERKTPEVPVWPTPRPTEDRPNEQGVSASADTNPRQTNPMSPPPIVVHDSKRWNEISKGLEAQKIGYNKAKLTRDGIYIHTNNEEEWRKATRYMEEFRLEFHTFTLKKEIPLHAVIRGIPENVEEADVAAEYLTTIIYKRVFDKI
nr:DNA ligase 1-like [Leptinotarsa decemlineata]